MEDEVKTKKVWGNNYKINAKKFYDANSYDINRKRAIKRMNAGKNLSKSTIEYYKIEVKDIKIHPSWFE